MSDCHGLSVTGSKVSLIHAFLSSPQSFILLKWVFFISMTEDGSYSSIVEQWSHMRNALSQLPISPFTKGKKKSNYEPIILAYDSIEMFDYIYD